MWGVGVRRGVESQIRWVNERAVNLQGWFLLILSIVSSPTSRHWQRRKRHCLRRGRTSARPFELERIGKASEINIGMIEFSPILTTTELWQQAVVRRAV